jgi:hypothetical protein
MFQEHNQSYSFDHNNPNADENSCPIQHEAVGVFNRYPLPYIETSDIQLSEYATCYEDAPKSASSIYINTPEPQDFALNTSNGQTFDLHQMSSTTTDFTKTNYTTPNHLSIPKTSFGHGLNVSSPYTPIEQNRNAQHSLPTPDNNCNDVFSKVSTQNYQAAPQFIDANTFVSPETGIPNMISANGAFEYNLLNISASHSDPSQINNSILPLDKDKPFDVIEIICMLQNDVKNLRQEVFEMRQFISNSLCGFGVK